MKKKKVVRLPVLLLGQFDDDYLDEEIDEKILEGHLVPIPSDCPVERSYCDVSRNGFNKNGVLVTSVIMMIFGSIEFLANCTLLTLNSNITYVLVGCICAVFLAATGAVGAASSCTLEDCPIGTTMIFATLTSLTSFGQFGISAVGIMVDVVGLGPTLGLGATAVTDVVGATAMHGFNGLTAIVGGVCSIVLACMTCSTVCCSSRRFVFEELRLTHKKESKDKFKKPSVIENCDEVDSSGYAYRPAWPTRQQILANKEYQPRKRGLLDLIFDSQHKVAPSTDA
ncbi:uncharacterized protein LOC135487266 [Lineus longissimus]|uniref:uncharacterized protein LOC135487266 n=1 Tax=Lineus longissimus TaxID=88925 RepID=UPI002B4F39DC